MIRERNGMILSTGGVIEIDDAAQHDGTITLRMYSAGGSDRTVSLTVPEIEHLIIELRGAIERMKIQEQS